ncbi:ATP-binding cassette domain-containing protein [Hujiaoplasma nucleasis]|uniref:ATP-binding cassette domain-containing protein n=1 Tax=Hujiaoplasma nucleasis TaxID=2725268 RepID=A0A7L6N5D1_9MOLU|nr:ATP-binding cassette domain-containing protein [Hujiaoplasma nucleasis]QLY39704.1 ATP-binding cassette domain-containing protein [Hujiaoplasma nucleasis]
MDAKIKVDNIKKTFTLSKKQMKINKSNEKRKVAVNGLSFEAFSGQIYGLLGPNGAGKTTTLRCISTLIKPDEGDIYVKGHSVLKDPYNVRKNIGFLTSDLKLEEFFTPDYMFDFFARLHGLSADKTQERKEELFAKFGIDHFRQVKISDLSTGMRQKVQLVISIVHDPEIIIFDEPTNGLDIITAKIVTDFLIELKEKGKTIIVSTHIFSLVEKICDRVGIIIDGLLIYDDSLEAVHNTHKDVEDLFFDLAGENLS